MGFRREARVVRDPQAPLGRRFLAFAHCVEMYSPLGFQVTFAFVTSKVSDLRRGPQTLAQGMDFVEVARDTWRAEFAAYTEHRRAAKSSGQRSPVRGRTTPLDPPRWHSAPEEGALFALAWHRGVHDATGFAGHDLARRVYALIDDGLAHGDLEDPVASIEGMLAPMLTSEAYRHHPSAYFTARGLHQLGMHLRVARGEY
jgi:hypothetical protein